MVSDNGPSGVKEQAQQVAGDVKEQAHQVVGTATADAREASRQVGEEIWNQADQQRERLAEQLREAGRALSESNSGSGDSVALVGQAGTWLSSTGDWLAERDPRSIVAAVEDFARRRPWLFLLGSAAAGVVVGRITRVAVSGATSSDESEAIGSGEQDQVLTPAEVTAPPLVSDVRPVAEPAVVGEPPLGAVTPGGYSMGGAPR